MGRVSVFVRRNGRSPAEDFFEGCQKRERNKFKGQFDALTKHQPYENYQRFRPLKQHGKPLWEFKEFDHRLYCLREQNANSVEIVLFNGWVKQKEGKTEREYREIRTALALLGEYQAERLAGGKERP